MNDSVKPKRAYRSRLRKSQAEGTRAAVLQAAGRLFTTMGWQKTTIAAIARDASVSNETVYVTFGNKKAILQALIEAALRGAAPETPLLEQAGPRAVRDEVDQRRQLARFAADITAILSRIAPLVGVVRSAAEADPEMAELYALLHRGRRRNLEFAAESLLARGPLRAGIDVAAATAIIWRLASPELFLLVTEVEGLSRDAYATWLAASLATALLDGP